MFENEKWAPIEEFPQYMVSNYGRIKHVDRVNARIPTVNERGFVVIQLSTTGPSGRCLRQVNHLVAEAFLPPPDYADENAIWHIDGDLKNCRAENLRWEMRSRVLEWNEMHRRGTPKFPTPKVKNNDTGEIYANAYECAMAEGILESKVIFLIERASSDWEDDSAKYRYVFGN